MNFHNLYLTTGDDGFYCLSYKTVDTPDADEIKAVFENYGMFLNFNFNGKVVYLRSKNVEDIKRCIADLGGKYNFKVNTSSRRLRGERSTALNQQPDTENYKLLSNKPARVLHVVIANLPPDCTTEDIYDLCADVGVCPALIQLEQSLSNKVSYSSVYVKTEEDVVKLCENYNNFKLKEKKLMVKSANELLTSGGM